MEGAAVRITSKLDYYEKIKTTFEYEPYLDILANSASRRALTQLRMCSHNLEIEFGRFNNISRENRLCKLCNMKSVESEFHFLLCCPKYNHLRSKYLKKRYTTWPSIQKFVSVMSSKNRNAILNLGKFVNEAFKFRLQSLEIT